MKPSIDCLSLIKASEGLRLTAYQDGGGKFTIGYGHTHDVCEGQVITIAQADEWLDQDANNAGAVVNELVKVKLSQGQYDALTDFVFNVGSGAFAFSGLLHDLNHMLYHSIPNHLRQWIHDEKGNMEEGLVRRREAEIVLWNKKST